MKDGIIVGMALGVILGCVLTKNSPEVKKMVEKGEKAFKENVKKIKSQL